jgi:hypothetical protein
LYIETHFKHLLRAVAKVIVVLDHLNIVAHRSEIVLYLSCELAGLHCREWRVKLNDYWKANPSFGFNAGLYVAQSLEVRGGPTCVELLAEFGFRENFQVFHTFLFLMVVLSFGLHLPMSHHYRFLPWKFDRALGLVHLP